jgi:hypothetical protein
MREYQVRICEGLGVKFPGPTRQKRRFDRRPITSGLPQSTDIARPARLVRLVPKPDLCTDGDLGLTTRSEAALEPPRFISRMLTGRRTSVRRQAWSWYADVPGRVEVVLHIIS